MLIPNTKIHFITMVKQSIRVTQIFKNFGKKKVLEALSLDLDPGSVFGLVGLNGAGKTTLIRIMLGLMRADQGSVSILGMNPTELKSNFYHNIGVVLEHSGFNGNLSVRENLSFFSKARGLSKRQLNDYFSQYWEMSAIGQDQRKIKYFSRGQKMQCALCRAFLGWPEVYFFDEPAVALDIEAYEQFCQMVQHAKTKKATIVISSHQLEAIEELCSQVGILEKGKIRLLDNFTPQDTTRQWLIRTANNPKYKDIIKNISGSLPVYKDNCWFFSLPNNHTQQSIATIITRLVTIGSEIYEVKSLATNFRESLKYHLQNKTGESP